MHISKTAGIFSETTFQVRSFFLSDKEKLANDSITIAEQSGFTINISLCTVAFGNFRQIFPTKAKKCSSEKYYPGKF